MACLQAFAGGPDLEPDKNAQILKCSNTIEINEKLVDIISDGEFGQKQSIQGYLGWFKAFFRPQEHFMCRKSRHETQITWPFLPA